MIFGEPKDFAIEAYHEPSGPEWAGFGRICIVIQGVTLGDIRENHSSLFHAVSRIREVYPVIETFLDESFTGLSDAEIYAAVEHDYRVAENSDWERFRFYFLTFVGEPFDGFNIMVVRPPGECVRILYSLPDDTFGTAVCSVQSFKHVSESFVQWFDEQVRTTAPPFYSINSLNPNETIPDTRNTS